MINLDNDRVARTQELEVERSRCFASWKQLHFTTGIIEHFDASLYDFGGLSHAQHRLPYEIARLKNLVSGIAN
ncbi:hypothetical protein [Bradyrhizobium ottawaense]|uniref:hypothetical protein n=1 Tax=Bradyrhizobium ottawaense TaxID=931866 RepID=UPI003851658C